MGPALSDFSGWCVWIKPFGKAGQPQPGPLSSLPYLLCPNIQLSWRCEASSHNVQSITMLAAMLLMQLGNKVEKLFNQPSYVLM